jgi:DUF3040 family protein
MSLNHRQQRELQRIESRLLQSEPHLAAMLAVFGKLSAGECVPAREQVAATRMDRMRQAAVLIAKAFAGLATSVAGLVAAIDLLIIAVLALLTALVMGSRARPPQPAQQQTVPGANGR